LYEKEFYFIFATAIERMSSFDMQVKQANRPGIPTIVGTGSNASPNALFKIFGAVVQLVRIPAWHPDNCRDGFERLT